MVKRGQISVEYLIVVGFVVFLVISIVAFGFYYVGTTSDSIKVNQINNYANKLISNAESVFYAGAPSKISVSAYLPEGVQSVEIIENSLVISFSTSSGISKVAYGIDVPLAGNFSSSEGVKVLVLVAGDTGVSVSDSVYLSVNCGNGAINGIEQCDGSDLGGQSCAGLGFASGTLACTSSCTFDTTGCFSSSPSCGNGIQEAGEQCDGIDLAGQTCVSQGFDSGALACDSGCNFDTSACSSITNTTMFYDGGEGWTINTNCPGDQPWSNCNFADGFVQSMTSQTNVPSPQNGSRMIVAWDLDFDTNFLQKTADLSSCNEAWVHFFQASGTGLENGEQLEVYFLNGISVVKAYDAKASGEEDGTWHYKTFRVSDSVSLTSTFTLRMNGRPSFDTVNNEFIALDDIFIVCEG